MKKIVIICLLLLILIIGILLGTKNWKDEQENDNLTHVTLADATLTSRTYIA